jgi:hypothetical protein
MTVVTMDYSPIDRDHQSESPEPQSHKDDAASLASTSTSMSTSTFKRRALPKLRTLPRRTLNAILHPVPQRQRQRQRQRVGKTNPVVRAVSDVYRSIRRGWLWLGYKIAYGMFVWHVKKGMGL